MRVKVYVLDLLVLAAYVCWVSFLIVIILPDYSLLASSKHYSVFVCLAKCTLDMALCYGLVFFLGTYYRQARLAFCCSCTHLSATQKPALEQYHIYMQHGA